MKARPVVCMPDSGGAALAIYQYVCFGHAGTELDSSDSVAYEVARNLLPQIKSWGEREMGANKEKQLTFFSTEGDVLASNDLGTTILSSILSDCDKTVDAINLAVRWRDTDIIRAQLDESQEVDASGEPERPSGDSSCRLSHLPRTAPALMTLPSSVPASTRHQQGLPDCSARPRRYGDTDARLLQRKGRACFAAKGRHTYGDSTPRSNRSLCSACSMLAARPALSL